MPDAFDVGIEFDSVLAAISKQIYETPLAFIRENVQNAVDAVRMQAAREMAPLANGLAIRVTATPETVEIRDNGIGMTRNDLQNLFWTIGASGKRTPEARDAGCVGMFGIGGFANFGICSTLSVTSQTSNDPLGYETKLSREDIEAAAGGVPKVTVNASDAAGPRGTIVAGTMREGADVAQLGAYLQDFVRHATEAIYFNGNLISRQPKPLPSQDDRLWPLGSGQQEWINGNTAVQGRLFESANHTLYAELNGMRIEGVPIRLIGSIRFENGSIDVLKRGFKLCATAIGTQIGVSGFVDCDRLSPTAGRDSLDAESAALISSITACLEKAAVLAVLQSSDRIAQHTRIFRYVRAHGLIANMGKTSVDIPDGRTLTLADIRTRSGEPAVQVFYSSHRNARLAHLLQTRGNVVVQLPSDNHKRQAVTEFLTTYCGAKPLDGRVECLETYQAATRFEKLFLAELEETILSSFEVQSAELVPGRLSEDIPVYAAENLDGNLTIFVDVRHEEVTKLERLGVTNLFRSLVSVFCREYLGPTLRAHSPKFFGNGAINLDFLSKRRSELWVLVSKDIQVFSHGSHRQVVRAGDVRIVHAGGVVHQPEDQNREPKLVRIEGSQEFAALFGYYLRVPKSATVAYGDVIQQLEDRAAIWGGDKITLFASDGISTAFQFEVRLDQFITLPEGNTGALALRRPVQSLFDGLYFPIPRALEGHLVPASSQEIRIEVHCEWMDYSTARSWEGAA